MASLGFDLAGLEADGRLVIDAVRIDASEIVTTGDFDLDGLFIRLASAVQSVGARAGRPRHDRGAVRRTGRRGDRAERVQPAAAVAEGPRAHHGDHRRAWPGRAADPVRHRGVRLRLRDRPRPPDARRDRHPAAARGEVPRLGARHERVPLPGHRPGPAGLAHHLDRAHLRGLHRTGVPGRAATGRDAGRRRLPRLHGAGQRHRRHRQDDAGGLRGRRGLRPRRIGPVRLLRGVARPDHPQPEIGRHRPGPVGRRRAAAAVGRAGDRLRPRGTPRRRSSGCWRRPNRPSPSSTRSAASATSARRRR